VRAPLTLPPRRRVPLRPPLPSLRVPAALSVARALDTLSVSIDPSALALTDVTPHAGTFLGIETDTFVFREGHPAPVTERRASLPGADFAVCATSWDTARDGIPAPDTRYVVEMQLVLFETDVPPAAAWDPRAGHFTALWTRTLRQAEE
jgi:hypothetical protein